VTCHLVRVPASWRGRGCRALPLRTGASEQARSKHPRPIGLDHSAYDPAQLPSGYLSQPVLVIRERAKPVRLALCVPPQLTEGRYGQADGNAAGTAQRGHRGCFDLALESAAQACARVDVGFSVAAGLPDLASQQPDLPARLPDDSGLPLVVRFGGLGRIGQGLSFLDG
jgi:hypothetical protein